MENRVLDGFPSGCGRVLCVRRRGTVHALFADVVSRRLRRLSRLRVRTRTDLRALGDCLGLRRAEAVLAVVPRFGLYVQSERTAAPTPWTHRFARKPAVSAIGSSPSVWLVIAAMPIARRTVVPPGVGVRSRPPVSATAEVRKGASIIGIISARIASA